MYTYIYIYIYTYTYIYIGCASPSSRVRPAPRNIPKHLLTGNWSTGFLDYTLP